MSPQTDATEPDFVPERRGAIHRVGRVVFEDNKYRLPGWWIAGRSSEWPSGPVEQHWDATAQEFTFTFFGWSMAELAEISLAFGEGEWLTEPLVDIDDLPDEFKPKPDP